VEPGGEGGQPLTADLATPMMKQYQRLKAAHPDALLFFRLGDFYEMFFEDAEIGARELEITLTSRTTGAAGRVPMCGIPYHAAGGYLSRLVEKGYKVAICDQVEDPRKAKGLVRRDITRVVTPGTLLELGALPEKGNNYIVSVAYDPSTKIVGLARLDFSTGEFRTAELGGNGRDGLGELADELACLEPAEVIIQPAAGEDPALGRVLARAFGSVPAPYRDQAYRPAEAARVLTEHFGTPSLEAYGCAESPMAVAAAGSLVTYLKETQGAAPAHIRSLRTDTRGTSMGLDPATRRNLELVEPLRPGSALSRAGRGSTGSGTLLGTLDLTVTAAGGRLLRAWVLRPLVDGEAIRERLDAVAEMMEHGLVRADLRTALRKVYDMERLTARASAGTAGARDLLALRDSLAVVPAMRDALERAGSSLLRRVARALDPVDEVGDLVGRVLVDDPPAGLKDGGLVREGYSEEVDTLRGAASGGKAWIAALEADERKRTGIKSLKVGHNQVFGYYMEVTRPNLGLVPAHFERRQTLANAERFVTPELKEREAIILGAEEKLKELEYAIFCDIRSRIAREAGRIQATAQALAALDAVLSLAEAGHRYGYSVPEVVEEPGLVIKGGRHPVVERLRTGEEFVPNDCTLGGDDASFAVITGPNMAGKSTYCRQVALIALMAQMGSAVPATAARIGIVDRVFTRIGASDELSGGRSTFLVEMSETANILGHATRRSLIVLDEIGRGTSTYDGLSLAWAVAEHIVRRVRAITLFATHYHELTELETTLEGVVNWSISVREIGDDIVFLRKVSRGAVDRSYGIQVARLAGLPSEVIERARQLLHELETASRGRAEAAAALESRALGGVQVSLFEAGPSDIEKEIAGLDLVNMTPLGALTKLHELQERLRKGPS